LYEKILYNKYLYKCYLYVNVIGNRVI